MMILPILDCFGQSPRNDKGKFPDLDTAVKPRYDGTLAMTNETRKNPGVSLGFFHKTPNEKFSKHCAGEFLLI